MRRFFLCNDFFWKKRQVLDFGEVNFEKKRLPQVGESPFKKKETFPSLGKLEQKKRKASPAWGKSN